MAGFVGGISRSSSSTSTQPTASSAIPRGATQPSAPAPVAAPEPQEETPLEKLSALSTLDEAIAYVQPHMDDTTNDVSKGTLLLALWAVQRMKFADVDVKKDETTFARVMKDPDEERGKRLCVTGNLIEISIDKLPQGKLASGLLMNYGGNLVHFSGVGSSGDLVARSRARFCGVVVGRYSYSNSGGGTGHAIQVVGMFDIKENNPNKKVRRSYDDDY